MVVGKLVQSAAVGMAQDFDFLRTAARGLLRATSSARLARIVAEHGQFRCWSRYEAPSGIFWDDAKYRGEAYAAFAWAVYIAEVTVDLTTYSVSVDDFVALQEVGKVLHPLLARGQIIGGVAQGIGFSLYEKVVWQNGRMQNGQMTNYIMPTRPTSRRFACSSKTGSIHGAYGAKGIGELPMDGPAPAILNAVEDALGSALRFRSPAAGRHHGRAGKGRARCIVAGSAREFREWGTMTDPRDHSGEIEIAFTVNGEARTVHAYPMERLLDVLRENSIDGHERRLRRRRMRLVLGADGRRPRE